MVKVRFLLEKDSENEVWAFFPTEIHATVPLLNGTKEIIYKAYSPLGQHTSCNMMYATACKDATPEQFEPIKKELEAMGYSLDILNK
jgi:hypothetical protein